MTRTLPYNELPDAISKRALTEHLKVWGRFESTSDEVDEQLYDETIPSSLRRTYQEQSYAINGDRLHELYFGSFTADPVEPDILLSVEAAIERRWGSMDGLRTRLRCAVLESNGWIVLGYDTASEDFRIIVQGTNDSGFIVRVEPLLVIDMFEHAYWMDHGSDRMAYFDALWPYVNWREVDRRYRPLVTLANPYEHGS